jgi:diguanylate cyclase (GGDEF)-like protein
LSTTDDLWPDSASVHAGGSGEPVTSRDALLHLIGEQGPDEAIAATRLFLSSMVSSSRHEDVLAVAEHGIALCSAEQHRAERLEFMLIKGWRLLRLVALESAALVLAEADSLALQIGNRRGSAEVLRQIGMLHGLAGDMELADRNFSRSIDLFRSEQNDFDLSDALMGLSVTRWRQGQRKVAIELAVASIEAATRSGNWNVTIHANANLASYYLETDDFQMADAPLSSAEQIYVERGMVPFWGWALTLANRADFLDRAGEPSRAVDLYLRAIAMCEQLGEVVMRPPIEKMIASLLEKQGDFKGAFNHLQAAHQFHVANANRGRALEIQALRGSLELTNERREKHHLGEIVEQRTEELQREIDTRRAAEERAHALAFNDPLTGLPNRRRLTELLEQALVHAHLHGTAVGVLFVDLDQFSLINDASGHEVGDLVLVEIAGRLKRITGARESVCRFGGDEFVIVVPELKTDEGAVGNVDKVIEEVFAAFAEPFQIGASERSITASIGVARYPEHSQDAAQLVRFADIAMYAAKRSGRLTVAEFSESLSDALVFRSDLTRDFRRALTDGQFHLAYQPKVEVTTGQVVGLEALARWDHPGYGSVPPSVFIGFFEETGAIHEFGRWAIRTVCSQLARWRRDGARTIRVAVNVSQKQLQDHSFADFSGECLLDAGVDGGSIEIEITESTLLTDPARVIEVLQRISKLGVHISIDDFGTGYSSLSLLSKLPFDSIKIDQSFIATMLDGASERMIVQTIIRMAEALGKSVTAEGVETKAQLDALAFERCGFCQGALFGMAERAALIESRIGKVSS